MNADIRAPQVRLIAEDGEKIGIVSIEDALRQAEDAGLDLVEVAPDADPPVCRVLDYSKMQYEKQRKKKEARKHQRHTDTKEVKLRPNIDEHDYQTKLKRLRDFIQKGHKAKITLIYRAREMRRYEVGREVVERMIKDVADLAQAENMPRGRPRVISIYVHPNREIMAEAERQVKEELAQKKEDHDRRLAAKAEDKAKAKAAHESQE